jgi:hypothetical protein
MDFRYVVAPGDATRVNRVADVASRAAAFLQKGVTQAHGREEFEAEAQWRSALRAMSEEARATGVPVEQLLVEVKQALAILYDTCAVPFGPARTAFTDRVVTLCIDEYYSAVTEPERNN